MTKKKHAQLVAGRFVKAMKQIIANEIKDVTNRSQFAEKVGEYKQNISKIESGERYPTIETICTMCLVFGVDPGWILLERGEMFGGGQTIPGDFLQRLNNLEKIVGKSKKQVVKKVS